MMLIQETGVTAEMHRDKTDEGGKITHKPFILDFKDKEDKPNKDRQTNR